MPKKYTEIGKRLKDLRRDRSQADFAKEIGTTLRAYQYYESGERVPHIHLLTRIAELCSTTTDWILTGEGDIERPCTIDHALRNDDMISEITRSLKEDPKKEEIIYRLLKGRKGEREKLLSFKLDEEKSPPWYEIARQLGLPLNLFELDDRNFVKTIEMDLVYKEIKYAIRSHGNLEVIGEIGTGKTVILRNLVTKFKEEGVKVSRPVVFSTEVYRVASFYYNLLKDIGENIRLSRRIDEWEMQARSLLNQLSPNPIVLFIDNAHDISDDIVDQLISFQQNLKPMNLTIVLFGYLSLPSLYHFKRVELKGLRPVEIKKYISLISVKSEGKLPPNVPMDIFKGTGNFFDIRDRYLEYSWELITRGKKRAILKNVEEWELPPMPIEVRKKLKDAG